MNSKQRRQKQKFLHGIAQGLANLHIQLADDAEKHGDFEKLKYDLRDSGNSLKELLRNSTTVVYRDFPDDAHAVDNAIAQIAALRAENERLRKNQFDPMIQGSAAASEGAMAMLEIVGEQMARQKEEIAALKAQLASLTPPQGE